MQTTENGYAAAPGETESTAGQIAPTIRKTLGSTTYIVTVQFSKRVRKL